MTYNPAVRFIDENGVVYGIKHVDNKPRVSAMPYLHDIAEGNVANHDGVRVVGYNADVGAAKEDIIEQGGILNLPLVATAMQLDGADAADTAAAALYDSTEAGTSSSTTLADTAQTFVSDGTVAVGDMILLDDQVQTGIITSIAETILTCSAGFTGDVTPNDGENYRVIDQSAGGTGVQVVEVAGLDGSYAAQSEFVLTNGAGTRALVNSYLRVNAMHAVFHGARAVGTEPDAAGIILLEDQATGLVTYAQISAGNNSMLSAHYTVPAGKTGYLTAWSVGASGSQPCIVQLRATADNNDNSLLKDAFVIHDIISLEDSCQDVEFRLPIKCPATSDIKVSAFGAATAPAISASINLWIES